MGCLIFQIDLKAFISINGLTEEWLVFKSEAKQAGYGLADFPNKRLEKLISRIRLAMSWRIPRLEAEKLNEQNGLTMGQLSFQNELRDFISRRRLAGGLLGAG